MENKKEFSLEAVLSVIFDKILVSRISEIRELCSLLIGTEINSHQLIRAVSECNAGLKAQCPQFDELSPHEITRENVKDWITLKKKKYGTVVLVSTIIGQKLNFDDSVGEMKKMNFRTKTRNSNFCLLAYLTM